jgi:hypothetical protein
MANLQNNRFSATFTQKETDELATSRTAYSNVLRAKTVALTPEEREDFNGIEVDNYVFVKDTLHCNDAEGVAMMPPAYAAMAPELVSDNTAFDQLDAEKLLLKDLLQRVEDTQRLVAHEGYSMATKFYKLYKQMAEDGVPGAAARYELLKKRFKDNGAGRPKDEPTVE